MTAISHVEDIIVIVPMHASLLLPKSDATIIHHTMEGSVLVNKGGNVIQLTDI